MKHVFGGFGSQQALGIKPYSQNVSFEVWYGVVGLEKQSTIRKNGITYKLFPATTVSKMLESYYGFIKSPQLFAELLNYDPKKTIIHMQGERGSILHDLLKNYSQYPLMIQYHGYGQPEKLDFIESYLIKPSEHKHFPRVEHFFVPIKPRIAYLRSLGIPKKKISFENIGIDFNIYKPQNKLAARKKLNLPEKSFVMLFVGQYIKSKGVDLYLETYIKLKKKYPHLHLLLLGGSETDEYYKEAQSLGADVRLRVDHDEIVRYYNAADVYCFYGNEKMRRFAGPGIACTEALCCNLPVISTNLSHFPDTIYRKLGKIPKSRESFEVMVEDAMRSKYKPANTRKIIESYASFQKIAPIILHTYEETLSST
jgi:glycosyltransferase involved in cell wall biosynthesis